MEPPKITEELHMDVENAPASTVEDKYVVPTPGISSEDLTRLNARSRPSSPSPRNQNQRTPLQSRSSSIGGETGSDSSVANSPLMDRVMFKRVRSVNSPKQWEIEKCM